MCVGVKNGKWHGFPVGEEKGGRLLG